MMQDSYHHPYVGTREPSACLRRNSIRTKPRMACLLPSSLSLGFIGCIGCIGFRVLGLGYIGFTGCIGFRV